MTHILLAAFLAALSLQHDDDAFPNYEHWIYEGKPVGLSVSIAQGEEEPTVVVHIATREQYGLHPRMKAPEGQSTSSTQAFRTSWTLDVAALTEEDYCKTIAALLPNETRFGMDCIIVVRWRNLGGMEIVELVPATDENVGHYQRKYIRDIRAYETISTFTRTRTSLMRIQSIRAYIRLSHATLEEHEHSRDAREAMEASIFENWTGIVRIAVYELAVLETIRNELSERLKEANDDDECRHLERMLGILESLIPELEHARKEAIDVVGEPTAMLMHLRSPRAAGITIRV